MPAREDACLRTAQLTCRPADCSCHAPSFPSALHSQGPGPTCLKVTPFGAAAVAAPVTALVAVAVRRVGAPAGAMVSDRLLEAGTRLLPTTAVASTV